MTFWTRALELERRVTRDGGRLTRHDLSDGTRANSACVEDCFRDGAMLLKSWVGEGGTKLCGLNT